MDLVLNSRFTAMFFTAGVVPNPIDIRFQRVSGLASTIETTTVNEGGQNLYTQRVPRRIGHDNLVLERGFVVGSPLNIEFNAAMSLLKLAPSNVLVTLLAGDATPLAGWMFCKAFPVRWATAELVATDDKVLIDTLELCYATMQAIRV
jgi:phage tail-like protein